MILDLQTYREIVELITQQLSPITQSIGSIQQSINQLNEDYTNLSSSITSIRTNLDWIMKFFWLMIGAAITNFIASLFYIITHYSSRRRNKDNNV